MNKAIDLSGVDIVKREIAADLEHLMLWANSRGLQLNPANSSLLVADSPSLFHHPSSFDISWGPASFFIQPTVKSLGVTLNSQ